MATVQQKVDCFLWLAELKSVTRVQRKFRLEHGGSAPSYNSIMKWDRRLRENGSVSNQKSPGRPRTSSEDEERIRQAFLRSQRKSIRTASRQLHLSHNTVYDVVHKSLHLRAYKLQLRQHIKPADRDCRKNFSEKMLQKIDSNETFLNSVFF
jgi:transposase